LSGEFRCPFHIIPANPGSGPGQAPESSVFTAIAIGWTPVSTGVTAKIQFSHTFGARRMTGINPVTLNSHLDFGLLGEGEAFQRFSPLPDDPATILQESL
jgi:hypothetical protein